MPEKNNCNTNIDAAKESNAKQEIHGAMKCCTNMDGILKLLTIATDQLLILTQKH